MKTGGRRDRYVIGGVPLSREAVVHRYLHLVKYAAARISVTLPPHVEIDDLINDGVLGLIDAVEKFDDARGVKFQGYALTRISGAILDALRALDWVPRSVRQRARELERVSQQLETELGRTPDTAEVASRLGITVRELDRLAARLRDGAVLSLEERLPNERGHAVALSDTLEDDGGDVVSVVEHREVRDELVRAVDALSPQERSVIRLYYFEAKTIKEIKVALGVSESRVSQIHTQAVIGLRRRLRALRAELGYRENDPALRQRYHSRGEIAAWPKPRARR